LPRIGHWFAVKPILLIAGVVFILGVTLSGTRPAAAQATRTWVSGVGDDANPCSRTAPCKTFAGAISKTAAGGLIDCLDPGGFGAVTITKSISIDCSEVFGSVLVSGTNGIVVSAGATDVVTLRNLDVTGLGTGLSGIAFTSGAELIIEKVHIHDFQGSGIFFNSNQAVMSVKDSQIHGNGFQGGTVVGGGIDGHAQATKGEINLDNVRLEGNGFGVRFQGNIHGTIRNSTATSNSDCGFIAQTTSGNPVSMLVDTSQAADNLGTTSSCGMRSDQSAGGSAAIRLSDDTVSFNFFGLVSVSGGQFISSGNNDISSNVTSDGLPTSTIPLR
jgi:hypothetical protein